MLEVKVPRAAQRLGAAALWHGLQFAAVALLAAALPAAAALYKWTDAGGRTVYSDQPPPPGVKSEQLNAAPPPANPNAVREMAEQEAELKKRQQDRVKQGEDEAKTRADAAKRNTNCASAKAQVQALGESQRVVYRYDEKGQRYALDGPARAREQAELQRWIATNCAK
jgi:hypothetical protein